ncbi:unnamed protein product [Caenorhabditis brenneri]
MKDKNEKLKKKLKVLEEEKCQIRKDLQQFQHAKNDVKSFEPSDSRKDSKDQIKKLQDALDDEKKKTVESQAQCAKEKEKTYLLSRARHVLGNGSIWSKEEADRTSTGPCYS